MSEHTAGPWKIDKAASALRNAGSVEINAHDWDALAVVYVSTTGEPSLEGEANARLIAAAPDLLESLIELADCGAEAWGEDRPCVKWARAAIARATGDQP